MILAPWFVLALPAAGQSLSGISPFIPRPGEIRVEGQIRAISANGTELEVAVERVETPGHRLTPLLHPRMKPVAIQAATRLRTRDRMNQEAPVLGLVPGLSIIAVGQDLGLGKTLPAREVMVWSGYHAREPGHMSPPMAGHHALADEKPGEGYHLTAPPPGPAPGQMRAQALAHDQSVDPAEARPHEPGSALTGTGYHFAPPAAEPIPAPGAPVQEWIARRDMVSPAGAPDFQSDTLGAASHGGLRDAAGASAPAEVRALTGVRTRIVWAQSTDVIGKAPGVYRLMCMDTDDGQGDRVLVPGLSSCVKPLIDPSGQKVVFSNRSNGRVYVVNWNGTGLHFFITGYAVDVWRDPRTGVEWVYARTGVGNQQSAIRRFHLDNPHISQLVWDKTPLDQENYAWFQVSADGKRAAAAFPWPKCGEATLPNGSWQLLGAGCWTSLAPDNSYRYFHFDGTHKHVILCEGDGSNPRVVTVNNAPGITNDEVLYPRWTNNVHFITMSGPADRGDRAEVYIGRFNDTYSAIDQWVRVTYNDVADIWADAWIEPAGAVRPAGADAAAVERMPRPRHKAR